MLIIAIKTAKIRSYLAIYDQGLIMKLWMKICCLGAHITSKPNIIWFVYYQVQLIRLFKIYQFYDQIFL